MLKLESVALELFEYKVGEIRARRNVRGGLASVWDLYHHLQRQSGLLDPDEKRRFELSGRILQRSGEPAAASARPRVAEFSELVVGGDGEAIPPGSERQPVQHRDPIDPAKSVTSADQGEEQQSLQGLAAKVWRHDLDRFVRRLASGLRAERDRYTARLLYAVQRNLHLYSQTEPARGDERLQNFAVSEAMPDHDDPFLSVNDVDSLAELVNETIDSIMRLADEQGQFSSLGVRSGNELSTLRALARAVAADPYAGRTGLLQQRGPTAQQLRVAIQEVGKERLRDEERLSQRRQLEERLQRVLAFERHQRQLFHQDVANYTALVDAFFDRLAPYLPLAVGGQAGPPRLSAGVLFAVNPALRVDRPDERTPAVTARLKGSTRLKVAGLDVSISAVGTGWKLYVAGEERSLEEAAAVRYDRKWLYAFREGDYLHLKVEDEGRSVGVRVAEAGVLLAVLASPEREALLAVMRVLANTALGEPHVLVPAALENLAQSTAKAADRAAAVRGFLLGAARVAKVELSEEAAERVMLSCRRAFELDTSDLKGLLEEIDLGEVAVHTLTGEPLAIEVGTFTLTVRQYRGSGPGDQESLVVMLPGHALGTFDEYLIEPLGDGLLVCVRGDQELVVGWVREAREEEATA